jgi:hypothetical protein
LSVLSVLVLVLVVVLPLKFRVVIARRQAIGSFTSTKTILWEI